MCDCNGNGLGAITGRPVHLGAPFQLGVELAEWGTDLAVEVLDPFDWSTTAFPDLLRSMESKLAGSGYTSGLVKIYRLAGYVNPYIVVESYSGREYGSDQHLKDAVLSVLASLYPKLNYGSVTFSAETYDPATGQTQITTTPAPRESTGSGVLDQVGQTIGSTFGLDTQSALLLGALGAVGLVLLLRR